MPFSKAVVQVRTRGGSLENAIMVGIDDASLVAVPDSFVLGAIEDLTMPDCIAINPTGFRLLFPGQELDVGRELELNDRRAKIVAIIDSAPAFAANLTVFARYTNNGRNTLSFVLSNSSDPTRVDETAQRSADETDLKAVSSPDALSVQITSGRALCRSRQTGFHIQPMASCPRWGFPQTCCSADPTCVLRSVRWPLPQHTATLPRPSDIPASHPLVLSHSRARTSATPKRSRMTSTPRAVEICDVSEARTQRLSIARDRVSAERDALLRLVDLYAALGGGWNHPGSVAAAE